MYLNVLPLHDVAFAPSRRLAVISAHSIFGPNGAMVIAIMIMISTFGCNNGLILAGARSVIIPWQRWIIFKKTGTLNKNAVPEFGLWIQAAMASILCLSGSYGDLLDMISFVAVLFYALTILGIFILRKKRPDAERPYKGVWLSCIARHLYNSGLNILCFSYPNETKICRNRVWNCFGRCSFILSCSANKEKRLGKYE